jgi:hypothetical protein
MRILATAILTLFIYLLPVQSESLFVEMSGDTVTIWNKGVWENCAFVVEFSTEINDSLITIVEHDTVTDQVTCTCAFDLNVKLTNLEKREYIVKVYRQYSVEYLNPDSLYFIGTTNFSFQGEQSGSVQKQYYQSSCYYPDALDAQEIIPENLFLLSSYPNPFNAQTKLEIYLPYKATIALKLYDLSGKLIETIASETLSNGNHIFNLNAENYSSGNYIVTLESDNIIKKSTKIVLVK